MVAQAAPPGLIVATRSEATSPLDELARCCGWPMLLEAGPRRLLRELSLRRPECVLFWTDDWRDVTSTAALIAWLRQRGDRPLRLAVAYQLAMDVEAVFRAAGAHSFLPIAGRPSDAIAEALWQLVAASAPTAGASKPIGHEEFATELVRPP